MATNIKTFNKRGGDGVIISSTAKNRIIGIHSYSTIAGVIAIGDQTGNLVTYEVPASAESDMYLVRWVFNVVQQLLYLHQMQVVLP